MTDIVKNKKKTLKINATLYEVAIVFAVIALLVPIFLKTQFIHVSPYLRSFLEENAELYYACYAIYAAVTIILVLVLYFSAYRYAKFSKFIAVLSIVIPVFIYLFLSFSVCYMIFKDAIKSRPVFISIPYNNSYHDFYNIR